MNDNTKMLEATKTSVRSRRIGALGSLMDLPMLMSRAEATANEFASRSDVPLFVRGVDLDGNETGEAVPVAPDLADRAGRWHGTSDGKSINGLVLVNDIIVGSTSAAAPVLIGVIAFFSILMMCFSSLIGLFDETPVLMFLFAGLSILSLLSALAGWVVLKASNYPFKLHAWFQAIMVPFLAGGLSAVSTFGVSVPGLSRIIGLISVPFWIGIAALVILFSLFSKGWRERMKGLLRYIITLGVLVALNGVLMPAPLQPLLFALIAAATPYMLERRERYERAMALAYQCSMFGGDVQRVSNANPQGRLEQAQRAEKDKSGFIPIAIATGMLTGYGDNYAPDGGLPVGLTCNDLSTHFHVFGSTGTGKTFGALSPVIRHWIYHNGGGCLVLDGKGGLALELLNQVRHLPNVHVIDHKTPVAPMEGLSPTEFISTIADVGGARLDKSGGSGQFFTVTAEIYGIALASVLEAMCQINAVKPGTFPARWTINSLMAIKAALNKPETGEPWLKKIEELHPDATNKSSLLFAQLDIIRNSVWKMPEQTEQSVTATFTSWLAPILQHKQLSWWADLETGADVTRALQGDVVGVVLPEAVFQKAGKICQKLIKTRLFARIKMRAIDPSLMESGRDKPCLFLMDEAQELINEQDVSFLSVSRSLGGYCVYATQNIESYYTAFGRENTHRMLGNFRSQMTFRSSPETHEALSEEFGEGKFMTWTTRKRLIGYLQTAKAYANQVLFDPDHPLAPEMRKMVRGGAGWVKNETDGDNGWGQKRWITGQDAHLEADSIHMNLVISGEMVVRKLVTEEDLNDMLNRPRTALAMIMRAGQLRRDYVTVPHLSPADVKKAQSEFKRSLIYNHCCAVIESDIRALAGDDAAKQAHSELVRRREIYIDRVIAKDEQFSALLMQELNDAIRSKLETIFATPIDLTPLAIEQRKEALIESWGVDEAKKPELVEA